MCLAYMISCFPTGLFEDPHFNKTRWNWELNILLPHYRGPVLMPHEFCGWTLKTVKSPHLRVSHINWNCSILISLDWILLYG